MEQAQLTTATESPTLPEPSSRYRWILLALLMPATIFEGYDITIFHLCTPDITRAFHLSDATVGSIAATVRFGGLLSFFVVTLADRFGRKPMLANTVLCYAVFTLITAFSRGAWTFTLAQSSAQIFLAAEFGIAITMISEEFPDSERGRAVSILLTSAFIGVVIAGQLYGVMSNSRWGWRGMYLLGVAPLILVAWLRRWMRETQRFLNEQSRQRISQRKIFEPLRECLAPMRGPWLRRMLLVASLCNCVGLVGGPVISFFSLYAERDRGWTSVSVGQAFVVAYLAGSLGSMLSGYLLDRIGRRTTAVMFFIASAATAATLFRSTGFATIFIALAAAMFSYQGSRTATSALAAELFPTSARATGFCLTVQVFGQLGWILAPLCVGLLSHAMGGLGNAASLFAAGPIIGALLVITLAPETHGKTLEELAHTH
ncbi:MAG TPA: MFS transporter [Candidatus Binataceae bacterium]|nr:MFS transporter [Candidatus Binataceae bacterium]